MGCLAVGTARGGLGLLALTGAVQPAWASQPPQCALRGDAIMRTRMQCTRDADAAPHLLLVDIVQLVCLRSVRTSHLCPSTFQEYSGSIPVCCALPSNAHQQEWLQCQISHAQRLAPARGCNAASLQHGGA